MNYSGVSGGDCSVITGSHCSGIGGDEWTTRACVHEAIAKSCNNRQFHIERPKQRCLL